MSSTQKGNSTLNSMKNENYLNILKNENLELDNKLKKVNQLVSKLKQQISENEQEKNKILTTSNQKELDLQNIKKQLEEAKFKVDELKNKNKEQISSLTNQNILLKNNSEVNLNTIAQMQQKITDLELKLKSTTTNNASKKFLILSNIHNCSMALDAIPNKNSALPLPDILGIKMENKIENKDDNFFLTGRNELIEIKDNNQKLLQQLNILQEELNRHKIDKNNLNKELEKYNKEKKDLMNKLNNKSEILNNKINQENELNNNLMKQLMENKKIKSSLDNIQIKFKTLEKDKKELEDIILEQENKVNELSLSVKQIIEIMNKRNNEIINNKLYIKNLEETIRELNKEFRNMRLKKKNNNEINRLKTQLERLKKENMKLLGYNQTIETHRNKNYISIKNHQIISRNNKKSSNSEVEGNHRYRKIRLRPNIYNNNQNSNRFIPSAMNISNFVSQQRLKNNDELIQMHINRKRDYPRGYNYDFTLSPKKNRIENFNGNKNLNIINLNNIKIKNLGKLKYNKSVLYLHKLKNSIDNIPSINKYNDIKFESKEPTNINKEKIQFQKINTKNIPSVSDDKTSNTENTNIKNNILQTKSTVSNLVKLKENSNEIVEKEKIQEFKNLLQQIVRDIDS